MAKKTVIKSKPRKVIEFGKYGATKEKTIQEVQEIGTFRKEQPGVFGILTSMTTYLIIFMLLLFGTSAVHYQNNQESLSWIDANGEFKTNSYNVTVSYNLDTPQDDLNGYSLKEVFEDNLFLSNGDFASGTTGWNDTGTTGWNGTYSSFTVNNGIATLTGNGSSNVIRMFSINNQSLTDTLYYITKVKFLGSLPYQFRVYDGYTGSYLIPNDLDTYYVFSNIRTSSQLSRTYIDSVYSSYSNQGNSSVVIDFVLSLNLTDLGINLTKDEMDYWYSEYERLSQGNMLEDLKTLGAMPLASWNTMNDITRTLIDVYEYGMKLVFPIVDVVRRLINLV